MAIVALAKIRSPPRANAVPGGTAVRDVIGGDCTGPPDLCGERPAYTLFHAPERRLPPAVREVGSLAADAEVGSDDYDAAVTVDARSAGEANG